MLSDPSSARKAGWACSGFLIGIAVHSVLPNRAIGIMAITAVVSLLCVSWLLACDSRVRYIFFCLFFVAIGVWRFESGLISMPRGLRPLDPKGLAHVMLSAGTADKHDPRYWLGRAKRSLTTRASQRFSSDESALLSGILYGERSFSRVLNDRFRRAGLLHLVAVSGSNVTMLVMMVMPLFLWIGLHRRHAFMVTSFFLFGFVLFVGPSASVARAAIMGWLVGLAPIVGRIPRPSRLLLLSAVAFVFWHPWALFFDASFALSFLAMWGLLLWSPLIDEKLSPWITWKNVRAVIASTVGATVMTAPYAAWAFGQMTVFGLVTSVLAVPLVPWIMGLGIVALVSDMQIAIIPLRGFLQAILLIAKIPDSMGFGQWSHLSTGALETFGWYALLMAVWLSVKRKKRLIHSQNARNKENL